MSSAYQIISLVTLKTSTVSFDKLSRSLKLNSIVSYDGQPIGLVTHWDLVFFSRTWAGWALEDCGERPPEEVLVALSLVDQWLQDSGSVSSEELRAAGAAAARVAWAAAAARVAWAAGAAAGAARAAAAAEAAAAWAARAAAWAARAAAGAARAAEAAGAAWAAAEAAEAAVAAEAAAEAAGAAEAAAYQRQGEFITEHLKNSSHSSFPFPRT